MSAVNRDSIVNFDTLADEKDLMKKEQRKEKNK